MVDNDIPSDETSLRVDQAVHIKSRNESKLFDCEGFVIEQFLKKSG